MAVNRPKRPIQPFHLIVTRPENQAEKLIGQLKNLFSLSQNTCERGDLNQSVCSQSIPSQSINDTISKINHFPLIRIENYQDQTWQNLNNNGLSSFDGVIFISGNAVEYSQRQLNDAQWNQLLKNPLYAVGQQTAKYLQSHLERLQLEAKNTHQQRVKYPLKMNSEGLLSLPELQQIKGQSWLVVKGCDGRQKLKRGLQSAGAIVSEVCVYQRKLPDLVAPDSIASYNHANACWLVTSLQALTHLALMLKTTPMLASIIVSSDRIAREAKKMGFKVIAQSVDATDQQLVRCVKQMFQVKGGLN